MNSSKRSAKYQEKMQGKVNLKPTKSVKSNLWTKYNPRLPKRDGIIKKHISILHNDDALKTVFPKDWFSTIYKRNKNLKELIAPSVYPKKINTRISSITSCDICKNYMIFDNTFICTVTGRTYSIKVQLNC